jgi:signal peptidase I
VTPDSHDPALVVDEPGVSGPGAGGDTPGEPPTRSGEAQNVSPSRWLREGIVVVVVAVLVAVLLRAFVVQTFYIPSGSMEPTLQIGDRILVNKLSYDLHGVHRGDIVVFARPPAENCGGPEVNDLVKRVIGLPGNVISLSGGYVYIDGKRLDESWLPASEQGVTTPGPPGTPYSLVRPYRVPANDYFMMGDNRTDSCDSRYWGPIPGSLIVGKVDLRVWPLTSIKLF